MVQLSRLYMTTGKTVALIIWTFAGKVICLLFKTLSRFDLAILPRSKCILILWLQSPSTLTLEPKQMKSDTVSTSSPSICYEVMGLDAMILVFECWVLSQLFHFLFSPSSRGSLVPLHFLLLKWYHLHIWGCYFSGQSWLRLVHHLAWHSHNVLCIQLSKQPWCTPFPILNQFVPCPVITVASYLHTGFSRHR